MTFIYEYDLDILKTYTSVPKTTFLGKSFQTLEHKHDRQTDRQTDRRGQTHYHAALVVGGSKDDVITCFLLGTA